MRSIGVQDHVRNVVSGVGEMRRVRDVQRLGPELDVPSLRDGELTEQSRVEVERARSADDVESRRSERGVVGAREGQRIEVRLVRSRAAGDRRPPA